MATETMAPSADDALLEEGMLAQPEDAAIEAATVSLSEMFKVDPADGSTEKKAAPAKAKPDAPDAAQTRAEKTFTQTELNRILGERLEAERGKITNSKEYQFGRSAISARAKRDGVSEDEAYSRIQREEDDRIAELYVKDPRQFYKDMRNGAFNPNAQPEQVKPQAQYRYTPENVAESLQTFEAGGTLPQGFSPESVTNEFVIDAMQNGTEAALFRWMTANPARMATRETVADEQARRRQLPKPMQTSGSSVASKSTKISDLSAEDFARLDEQIAQGTRRGMPVRIEE